MEHFNSATARTGERYPRATFKTGVVETVLQERAAPLAEMTLTCLFSPTQTNRNLRAPNG